MGPEDFNIDETTTTDVTETAAPRANQGQLDLLAGMQAKGQPGLTTDYVNAYTPQGLSPDQLAAYEQQNNPATGRLPNEAYYPDINHNINVGNYSGSEIGSTTLFAPGGGLVPLGMMDARDAAVQHAALKKAKDVEDFKKKYQSPTTKHTAVQKSLTDNYYQGLNQWQANANKKAGGNAALATKMLEQDPNFQQWNKGMQDRAKMQDQGVEMVAQLSALEKDPNMVLDPSTRNAMKQFMSGEYAGADPFSPEGRQFTKNLIAMQGHADLDVKTNEALNKAMTDIEQIPITEFQTRGKNEMATELEKEYFSEPRLKNLAHDTYMSEFQGTGVSEDQVYNMLKAKTGEKIRRKIHTYDKYFKPDKAPEGEVDYSTVAPVSETAINVTNDNKVSEIYSGKSYKTSAGDEKQVISVPLSKNTIDVQGKNLNLTAGQAKGTVSQAFMGFYNKVEKRWLSPEEAKNLQEGKMRVSHDIVAKPAIMFSIQQKPGETGTPNGLILDPNEVKGKFQKKKTQKQGFDDKITELEKDAEELNAKRGGTGWPVNEAVKAGGAPPVKPATIKKEIKKADIAAKAAAAGYAADEYEKLLKQNGVTIK